MTEELLTPAELKARLKISTSTYTRLVSLGRIPFHLVGTMKRFVWAEVVAAFPKSTDTRKRRGTGPALDLVGHLKHRAAHWR